MKYIQKFENYKAERKFLVLVGPPSVGKSTWVKNNFPNSYIINRDEIVENVAKEYDWTYDDMFKTPSDDMEIGNIDEKFGKVINSPKSMPWAKTVFDKVLEANSKVSSEMSNRVKNAHSSGKDIIVDMTNMNIDSRKGALKAIKGNESDYYKIAVDFKFKGSEELIKKVSGIRAETAKQNGSSKTIPDAAFDRMFTSYQKPSLDEGFDEIIDVDNTNILSEIINK